VSARALPGRQPLFRTTSEQEEAYASFRDLARALGREAALERPVVCVQGLGFVGSAMAVAIASARRADGTPCFNVVGVDLATAEGASKIEAINAGLLPVATTDRQLANALLEAHELGNLVATTDERAFGLASVAVVDVPLDVVETSDGPRVAFEGFRAAIRALGLRLPAGSLLVVETTVPPGTCEKIVVPEIAAALSERALPPEALLVAHSYERVMPGDGYLDSIVNFWRSYAGTTEEAADACEAFLSQVVNTAAFPLMRLHSTTACETAKVLENSYRATTIALMEEWGRFAETVGIDLLEVVSTIRRRPTHSNMRQPGFGVGGYCLTKDPLLGVVAAHQLFELEASDFPFSTLAVETNRRMPLVSLDMLERLLDGRLEGRQILLLGVSYRPDVADTRHSPAETFVRAAETKGATVRCHDPLLSYWPELDLALPDEMPHPDFADAVVFAVAHREYCELDMREWLDGERPAVLDANAVLSLDQLDVLGAMGCKVGSIGRGMNIR
jgi:UDP-N-acetyl-D-glucosamine dehydrogenase